MKTLFFHPTGNANVRAAALGLYEGNLLAGFHTSIATFPGDLLDSLSNVAPFSELRRRRFDPCLKNITQVWPWLEMGRLLSLKAGFNQFIRHEDGPFSIDAVYRGLDKKVASGLKQASRNGAQAVYAYEDSALKSFQQAKHLGLQCLYDLPIGYWRASQRLLKKEKERWPEWSATLSGFKDSQAKLDRKDAELLLADRIFVASSFTAKTLQEFPGSLSPVDVIPYGFPPVVSNREYSVPFRQRALRLLFVGGLSQRKGIADLFAAVHTLANHVELTVVGYKASNNCPALDAALARHRWIESLPHEEVLQLMLQSDVLIFPSLFEGFGLVITEAMSQGTPVITTERTAGPDLITNGLDGWIIDAGSTEALTQAIETILLKPALTREIGLNAMEKARSRPWNVYGQELVASIKKNFLVHIK